MQTRIVTRQKIRTTTKQRMLLRITIPIKLKTSQTTSLTTIRNTKKHLKMKKRSALRIVRQAS
jgi:hypothetical protein